MLSRLNADHCFGNSGPRASADSRELPQRRSRVATSGLLPTSALQLGRGRGNLRKAITSAGTLELMREQAHLIPIVGGCGLANGIDATGQLGNEQCDELGHVWINSERGVDRSGRLGRCVAAWIGGKHCNSS